jgi:CAAX prenyl protease-like protein
VRRRFDLAFDRAALVRVAPFALFMLLLALRGVAPDDGAWGVDPRWLPPLSTLLAAVALIAWRRDYGELVAQTLPSWREVLAAVGIGALVFVAWIELDEPWMRLATATAGFRPVDAAGELMWPLALARWAGAALVVPFIDELFWRSLVMRWLQSPQFAALPPARVGVRAIALSTFLFMLSHTLWLAAIVAGLAYALLYVRTGKLWTAVIAHAVTNGALGAWVLLSGNWGFW